MKKPFTVDYSLTISDAIVLPLILIFYWLTGNLIFSIVFFSIYMYRSLSDRRTCTRCGNRGVSKKRHWSGKLKLLTCQTTECRHIMPVARQRFMGTLREVADKSNNPRQDHHSEE